MRRVGMLPGRMCLAEPGRATANLKVCTTKTARNIRAKESGLLLFIDSPQQRHFSALRIFNAVAASASVSNPM